MIRLECSQRFRSCPLTTRQQSLTVLPLLPAAIVVTCIIRRAGRPASIAAEKLGSPVPAGSEVVRAAERGGPASFSVCVPAASCEALLSTLSSLEFRFGAVRFLPRPAFPPVRLLLAGFAVSRP